MSGFNEDRAMAQLAEIVALECGVHPAVARHIRIAAALHDIGKTKIPGSILNKPGKLTAEEFEVVKTHTLLGAELLVSIQGNLGVMAQKIALWHHEWWSGEGGYYGKHTDDLPAYVAIVAVCDVFAALLSARVYKTAWPPEEAIAYIQAQAGTQFSPALVRIFIPLARNDPRVEAIFGGGDVIAGGN